MGGVWWISVGFSGYGWVMDGTVGGIWWMRMDEEVIRLIRVGLGG